jgi:hypothetical protein
VPPSNEQLTASRTLLHEVSSLFSEQNGAAVLVGGWVPDVLFPNAQPSHVGTLDVDFAVRMGKAQYAMLLSALERRNFHRGENGYQFFKNIPLRSGRTILCRLDLLTSQQQFDMHFLDARAGEAPEPIRGADVAFTDNSLVYIGPDAVLCVAGIVAFLVMKSLAMHGRNNEKDAYDIHFCIEAYPFGLEALATKFRSRRKDPLVIEALEKLAAKFRSPEDEGPRIVADNEQLLGEAREMRKVQVAARVQELIRLFNISPE